MMSAVDKLELAKIGTQIEVPQASAYRSTGSRRARRYGLRTDRGAGPGDRLSELSAWWATVAGTAPPRRVEQLWLSRPSSAGPARAEVLIRRFDAPDDVLEALSWGVSTADDAVDDGTDLVLLSVPDDTPAAPRWPVLAAHLLGLDAVEAMGWPAVTGLGDARWVSEVAALRDGLRSVRGLQEQPELLLETLGSPALAAGTALLLQTAARRTPVLLDGPGAAACALLAHRVARAAANWWLAADAGLGPLTEKVQAELRLVPLTRLGLRAEDGTAARIGLELLETAVARAVSGAGDEPDDEPDADGE